jgi:hypothetical protein
MATASRSYVIYALEVSLSPNKQRLQKSNFKSVRIASTTDEASGGSYDWGMEKAGARFSLGFELRDQGHYGFVLPAEEIIPSGEETLDGLAALLRYVAAAENVIDRF